MRNALNRLSRIEDATLGRLISLKGLKFLGGTALFCEGMHHATEAWHRHQARKAAKEQPELPAAADPIEAVPAVQPAEEPAVLDMEIPLQLAGNVQG